MQIECKQCSRNLNVPDEKVPKDKAFNLTCPGCKHKIRVDGHIKKVELYQPEEDERDPMGEYDLVDTTLMISDSEYDEDDEPLEIYDENDKLALIMDRKNEDAWSASLSGLEFKLQVPATPEQGVHRLKFHEFQVVVLNENFDETSLEESPVYNYIINMPMTSRRKSFVVLVGEKFRSTDNMEAFALSVNLVINERDIDKLDMILRKSINENETFYKIYRETLQAHGKI